MPQKSLEERAVATALAYFPSPTTLALDPGFSAGPAPTSPKTALRRCCAASQRSFDSYMGTIKKAEKFDKILAAKDTAEACCNAMPVLAGYEGVRDFIACAAHGILVGAIPMEKSAQLLYAAQVALASLHHQPKTAQIHSSSAPAPTHRRWDPRLLRNYSSW
jgi:hypothetical protein